MREDRADQRRVKLAEAPLERLAQRWDLRAHPTPRELGEDHRSVVPWQTARAQTVWQYRFVSSLSRPLPPSPASPGSGCPQPPAACCDGPLGGLSSHRPWSQTPLRAARASDPSPAPERTP